MFTLIILSVACWLSFMKIASGINIPYSNRGGGGGNSEPETPNPTVQAGQISAARDQYDPRDAQRLFEIFSNPQYGAGAFTAEQQRIRRDLFPQEEAVRNQLSQRILANLQSPTGISPEQQLAIDARRGLAQGELQKALRERANLGGGLYGGRSIQEEQRAVSELQNQFAEEDIGREERSRLNAIQGAIPYLQLLFPQAGISAPQFQSSVQDPNQYASGLIQQRGQNIQNQSSQDASRSALYSALFQGLGATGAGAFGQGGFFSR